MRLPPRHPAYRPSRSVKSYRRSVLRFAGEDLKRRLSKRSPHAAGRGFSSRSGPRHSLPLGLGVALVFLLVIGSLPEALPSQGATSSPGLAAAVQPSVAPPSAQPSATAPAAPAPNVGRRMAVDDARALIQSYTVQPGDTLDRIAGSFGLSPATIYWANKKALPDPQSLFPGQVLIIPPIDGVIVVAGPKDTLESIAARYGVDGQAIIDANDLAGPTILAGQILIIPGAETGSVPAPKGPGSSGAKGGAAAKSSGGRLVWPVPGHKDVTQRFGCTGVASEPSYGNCAHFHDAIDIGAPEGSSVVAAAAGTVIYAGWKAAGSDGYGGGLVVWISHGGTLYTTYNHLSVELVKVGEPVSAGQRIGSVGMTGTATGPHLHFEVWVCYPWTGGDIGCARNPLNYTR
jgi:murein DD-endopeptidase MepM/ murein hydrolase activator NlpD